MSKLTEEEVDEIVKQTVITVRKHLTPWLNHTEICNAKRFAAGHRGFIDGCTCGLSQALSD